MSRITTEALADLAAERDGLRIAVINAAFALQRIREIADLSPTWWNDPSAGVGRIAADAERELRVALGKAQP